MTEPKYRAFVFADGKIQGEVPNTMFEIKASAAPMPVFEVGILEQLESFKEVEAKFLESYPKLSMSEDLVREDLAKVGTLLKYAIALRDEGKAYEDGLRGEPGSGIGINYYAFRLVRILRMERDRLIMKFMVKSHQEMIRLSGEVVCDVCGDRYGLHVRADKHGTPFDPTLVRLCDGRLGKT